MMSRKARRAVPALVTRAASAAIAAVAATAIGVGAAPAQATQAAPVVPAAPALPTGCTQSGSTVTCAYTSAGEHQFAVPSGITSVTATAVGGQGGEDFGLGEPGGLGAIATGTF